MSDEKVPTYQEWVKARQSETFELRARASAYHDAAPEKDKGLWTWIRDTFLELNNAFHALEWVENYREENDFKVYQAVMENHKKIDWLIKCMLGLDVSASDEAVEQRAKEFSEIVDDLITNKKRYQKITQQKE